MVWFFSEDRKAQMSGPRMVLMTLISFVIGVGIAFMFIQVGKGYATGEIFHNLYLARDMALMNDAVYGVPGNLIVSYKEDVGDAEVRIDDLYVTLNKDSNTEVKYPFVEDRQTLDIAFSQKDNVLIMKQGDEIFYSDGDERFKNTPSCSPLDSEVSTLLIEFSRNLRGFLSVDSGLQEVSEEDFTRSVAEKIAQSFRSRGGERAKVIPTSDYNDMDYQRDVENYDIVLSLHLYEEDDNLRNNAVAYVNNDASSRNMACHLLSQFSKIEGITGTSIKTVDQERISTDVLKYPLSYGDNIIYLELGNIMADSSINLDFKRSEVADAIIEAIFAREDEEETEDDNT